MFSPKKKKVIVDPKIDAIVRDLRASAALLIAAHHRFEQASLALCDSGLAGRAALTLGLATGQLGAVKELALDLAKQLEGNE